MASRLPGKLPLAVIMITRDEGHNIAAVAENLADFATEIWVVDSYSTDDTVDRALEHGMRVYQRTFAGFGDQWNYAVGLPVTQPWTMKIDPDERLDADLKKGVASIIAADAAQGFTVDVHLYFLGRDVRVKMQRLMRGWRTGACEFTDVAVNEHAVVGGTIAHASGILEHHDSPNLHHWFEKQNRYTTAEAATAFSGALLAAEPRLLGTAQQRRMWAKRNLQLLPLFPIAIFLYSFFIAGAWRSGKVGFEWARMRGLVHRMISLKHAEMRRSGRVYSVPVRIEGPPHPGAVQARDDASALVAQVSGAES